ncbi:MAG: FtsQ-type POTRA domain-containing protein [Deltaproteobacteria bacterium]|nr:FtsQ-type POTRA domain-containing protein [Deltaproteobacteria bacterium]
MKALSFPGTATNWWRGADRRANRRTTSAPPPTRRRGMRLVLILVFGWVLWRVPSGWLVAQQYVFSHPYFAVTDIAIEAEAPFSQEDILTWSRLTRGMSVWAIDPQQVEARLLTVSGIRAVQVQREFPQRVAIHVQTRRPLAVIARPTVTYLDDNGVAFTLPSQQPELDLPYVTGLTELALDSVTARAALVGVLPLLPLATVWAEPLSEIHWDPQRGYTLFLARRHLTIRLGWETAPEKFTQVGMVLARLPVGEGASAVVDARFVNQVVVRPHLDEHGGYPRTPARPL